MKPHFKPLATALAATLQLAAIAAVPLAWDVRPGQPAPVMFDRYHGETLSFSATFRGFGELPFSPGADIRLWYQTNGMGQAWWSVPATIQSNVLSATWSPALDPGADRVSLFFGAPSNAYAAAVLRLRHSPGFAPGSMPDPESFHESDPVFTAWLSAYTPPSTSLEPSTNYTDAVAASKRNKTDITAYSNAVSYTEWSLSEGTGGEGFVPVDIFWTQDEEEGRHFWTLVFDDVEVWHGSDYVEGGEYDTIVTFVPNGFLVTFTRSAITNAVPTGDALALRSDIPAPPDLSPIQQEISDLRTESALVYRLYSGSNVVAEVTNYNSQVHAPELRLMQLNESNEYITVWTETNGLTRTLARANEYTDAAITSAAPRAWSRTTSGLGAEAPSNTTWISTPTTVIAGGFEYAKVVDTYGEVWVLTSNGMAAEFNPDTNAYFRISADDGTPVFSIEKSDAQIVGANAAGITCSETSVTVPVPVVSQTNPTCFWRYSLTEGDWDDGTNAPQPWDFNWTGGTGAWVLTLDFNGTRPSSLFLRFSFLQEGGVVIRHNATTDLSSGIYVNGIKYVPVANGSTLTWQAQ